MYQNELRNLSEKEIRNLSASVRGCSLWRQMSMWQSAGTLQVQNHNSVDKDFPKRMDYIPK